VGYLIETAGHLPHTCLASGWGNELADEFSSEQRPKVLHAATLISGPTVAWGTARFTDGETATLHRGHATDEAGKINFYLKRNHPAVMEIITFITLHESPKQFLLQLIVSELLFLMI